MRKAMMAALLTLGGLGWPQTAPAQLLGGPRLAGPGALQIPQLPSTVSMPRLVRGATGEATAALADLPTSELVRLRATAAERLIRQNPRLVEADDRSRPVVRGEVLAIAPTAASLARAEQEGFRVARRERYGELGIETVVLTPPRGSTARAAVERLRVVDPDGAYEFNHIYQVSGAAGRAAVVVKTGGPSPRAPGPDATLGLIDGSVAAAHPAMRDARVVQRAFAPGGARATDHATAVAALMVGEAGAFRGAAPGARLFAADVFGPTPAGGSAAAIAAALDWLAQSGASVINISLVGPPNRLLQAGVAAVQKRGVTVVAAVGNDGPAAPPLYPAGYPGVVAVTGVDGRSRVLPEASRGTHVDFAAPGAEMAAPGANGGYLAVRGTSFAAPLVAGLLARHGRAALQPVDLGAPGPDAVYGKGLVGLELRVPPAQLRARGILAGR